jgi:hypothetical protein
MNPVCALLGLPPGRRRALLPLLWKNFGGETAVVALGMLLFVAIVATLARRGR